MSALKDYERNIQDSAMQQSGAPAANPNDYGALSIAQTPISPEDVQSRKDIFNQAAQRLLQARQQMQAPYEGENLGRLSLFAAMGKASGDIGAEGYTSGMLDKANAEQKQQEAMQQYQQQQQGLDLQAQLAQILGNGASMADASALAAVGGQDKISDNLAKLDLYGSGKGNATLTAARELMKADPTLDFPTAFSIAKSGAGQGNTVKNGKIGDIPGSIDTTAKRKTSEKTAEDQAAEEVKKKAMFPKATSALATAEADADNLDKYITKAIPQVGNWTAGLGGVALEKLAGTPARDLAETLRTIKANATTAALQEMRDNSPTGGALGQVSDYEDRMLASKVTNLENAQSRDQLKENLIDLRQYLKERRQRVRKAYGLDFGRFIQNPTESPDISKSAYKTPEEIGAAYKAGKLTKEQAKAELKAHGIE